MTSGNMVQDAASGLLLPPRTRRQVVPYDDLQALNPSVDLPQISPDLMSALSILVAQGPNRPLLLTTDVNGRLQVSTTAASVTKLAAGFTGGGTVATVVDSSSFYPGQIVSLVGPVSGTAACTDISIVRIPDAHTLVFSGTCGGFNYVVGDYVVGGGDVRVTDIVVPINIGGQITMLPPGSPNPGDTDVGLTGTVAGHKRFAVDGERSCDVTVSATQVQPAAASVSFAAPGVGNAYVLGYLYADILNNSGAATTPIIRVWDGPSGTGILRMVRQLGCTAAQSVDRIAVERARLRTGNNNSMTIDFSVGGANIFQTIDAGVYIEGV